VVGGHELSRAQELLHTLERKEFLARARRSSVGSELEYSFRHALVRDVAYGQIPRAARAQRHQAAAAWITSLGRPEDHAEMLAHHALSALEFATAAGQPTEELAPIAARAMGEAGDRAARLQSLPAALGYYLQALELTPEDDQERGLLLLRAGRTAGEADTSDARELLEDALRVLQEVGDLASAAEAEASLGLVEWLIGSAGQALERFEHAVSLVAGQPDSRGKAFAYGALGRTLTVGDRTDDAEPILREALAIAERLDLADLRLYALHYLGVARVKSGDRSGLADLESSAALARTHDPTFAPRALNNFAATLYTLGEVQRVHEVSAEALRLAERFGVESQVHWQHMSTVRINCDGGDWEASLAALADDPSLLEEGYYHAPAARFIPAFITFARGGSPLEEIERALAEGERFQDSQAYLPELAGAAFVFSELGRTREAEELLRRYAGTVRTVGMAHLGFSPLAALAALGLGMRDELADAIASTHASRWRDANLAILAGRFAEGADELERMGVAGLAPFVRLAGGEALLSEGRRAEADEQLARAGEFFRRVGATRYLQRTEALLAATA
jgi:tetratricopeptide (TPR) repeat protein